MLEKLRQFSQSLCYRLVFMMGLTLFISFSVWAYFDIKYQREKVMKDIVIWADRLSETIKLGTHRAMMQNSREDINQSIQNIGKLQALEHIRIYNKKGEIKFSSPDSEANQIANIKDEACFICHKTETPISDIELHERIQIKNSPKGYRMIGVITPIQNENGCSTAPCHFHPEDKMILGVLDVGVSLKETDEDIVFFESWLIWLSGFIFMAVSSVIFIFIMRFVNSPIRKLIDGTRMIASGDYQTNIEINQKDELGQLATAFKQMGNAIGETQAELNRQRDEYKSLFEMAPCLITVQNSQYRLIRYNHEFEERFDPKPGDYCFAAYKGLKQKCEICPVEKTFEDGLSHYSEESGVNKDGIKTFWIVRTAPIKDSNGNVVAAMEMSIDISRRKELEEKLSESEKKYQVIFNNISNPVFVLDAETLEILDCNESVGPVYGYDKNEIISKSFMNFFFEQERQDYFLELKTTPVINRVKQINKKGDTLYVNVRVSPSEYNGENVLLVTIGDETKRLETELQIIQAGKMSTLGEMATGIAHELNQPLSVIKTASSFFMKKIDRKEQIKEDILFTLSKEIDTHVDRAAKIISHMRQFVRKSEMVLEKVQVNDILRRSFELFSQQLKLRGIETVWDLQPDLPLIMANPERLEQVFINLFLNARDSIEEKDSNHNQFTIKNQITLTTIAADNIVKITVSDTGCGIPPEKLDRIFEPFFTTKKVGQGTGLGLSITYGIIQECSGNISACNNKNGGATFVITVPVAQEKA